MCTCAGASTGTLERIDLTGKYQPTLELNSCGKGLSKTTQAYKSSTHGSQKKPQSQLPAITLPKPKPKPKPAVPERVLQPDAVTSADLVQPVLKHAAEPKYPSSPWDGIWEGLHVPLAKQQLNEAL